MIATLAALALLGPSFQSANVPPTNVQIVPAHSMRTMPSCPKLFATDTQAYTWRGGPMMQQRTDPKPPHNVLWRNPYTLQAITYDSAYGVWRNHTSRPTLVAQWCEEG